MVKLAQGQAGLASAANFIYRIYQGRKLESLRSMGRKNPQRAAQNAAQKLRNRRTKNYTNGAENC